MYQSEVKFWVGLAAAVATALAATQLPHPVDQYVQIVALAFTAANAYLITPQGSTKDKS